MQGLNSAWTSTAVKAVAKTANANEAMRNFSISCPPSRKVLQMPRATALGSLGGPGLIVH
jgi:hypothetical protein